MNRLAYERARESLQRGHQVMIFVHARKETVRTAQVQKFHTQGQQNEKDSIRTRGL